MTSSFTRKQLRVTFTFADGSAFNSVGNDTLVLEGLRVILNVQSAGATFRCAARIQIFGMLQSDMNSLTQLSWDGRGIQRCSVTVEANSGAGWRCVFIGGVIYAGPEYAGAPDVMLFVEAQTLYYEALAPADPISYSGSVNITDIVGPLAEQMGKAFEPNDTSAQLTDPYLPCTQGDQLQTACAQAGVDLYVEKDVIAITPRYQPRDTAPVLLSPATGLIGYPTLTNVGVECVCLYNPDIQFGGKVQIEGDVPGAVGDWYVTTLNHTLESEKSGGKWMSALELSKHGDALPLQSQ